MSGYLNWNWANEHVQTEIQNGEYVSSESTLVLAGPSRLDMLSPDGEGEGVSTTNSLIPLGLLQGIQVAQNKQLTRLFEIGSKRSYIVPGRLFASFSAIRSLFFGPSLLRLFYALAPIGPGKQLGDFGTDLQLDPDASGQAVGYLPDYSKMFPPGQLQSIPGFGATSNAEENRDFYVNLASELFNVPFGMALVFKDTRNRPYGAMYLEDCYIETHTLGVDAGSVVMAESVSGQFDRIAPIQLASASLAFGPGF